MKTLYVGLLSALLVHTQSQAQINLIGASVNPGTGEINLVQWEALDSSSVEITPTILDAYYFATSAFDAYGSKYYISGISGDSSGLYAFNSTTLEETLSTGASLSNIAEFDMSTGMMYNLIMESEEYINVYELDITTNTESLIGTIYEPGANGIVADAIGFDSNNGIMYYAGYTNDPASCIYAISVRDTAFSYTKTILAGTQPYNSITCVNYDNVNNKIFALNDAYDSLGYFVGRYFVELDKVTGEIIERANLVEFPYYIAGSSCFDQNTGTFMLAAIDTIGALKMLAFNTLTDTYVAGFIPNMVSEIVCDNSIFSKNAYSTTAISTHSAVDASLFPNPVTDILYITHTASGPVDIQIYSTEGKLVFSSFNNLSTSINVNVQSLVPGIYLVNLVSGNTLIAEKIIVQ